MDVRARCVLATALVGTVALGALATSGCYLSHERGAPTDGGPPGIDASIVRADAGRDAGLATERDAGVTGDRYFALKRVEPTIAAEACRANEGEDAFVAVRYVLDESCLRPGPVTYALSKSSLLIEIIANVWWEHGVPCEPTDAPVERTLRIPGLAGGLTYTLVTTGGGTRVSLHVNPSPPPVICTGPRRPEGAMCDYGCECEAGLACVPIRGDAVCTGQCRRPCNDELDCAPNDHCPPADFTLASLSCAPIIANPCPDGSGCPTGRACVDGPSGPLYCEWALRLSDSNRHPCRHNDECDPGLVCVENAFDGSRRCDVMCETADMRCPAMHWCGMGGRGGGGSEQSWVCEFIGE